MLKWKRIIKLRIYVHARIEIKSTYIMITQIYKNMCPLRTMLLLYYHVSMCTVKYGQCSTKFSSTCDHTQFLFWLELLSFKLSMLCFYYSCLYIGCFFFFIALVLSVCFQLTSSTISLVSFGSLLKFSQT